MKKNLLIAAVAVGLFIPAFAQNRVTTVLDKPAAKKTVLTSPKAKDSAKKTPVKVACCNPASCVVSCAK